MVHHYDIQSFFVHDGTQRIRHTGRCKRSGFNAKSARSLMRPYWSVLPTMRAPVSPLNMKLHTCISNGANGKMRIPYSKRSLRNTKDRWLCTYRPITINLQKLIMTALRKNSALKPSSSVSGFCSVLLFYHGIKRNRPSRWFRLSL